MTSDRHLILADREAVVARRYQGVCRVLTDVMQLIGHTYARRRDVD